MADHHVRALTPDLEEAFDQYVRDHPGGLLYHSASYRRLLTRLLDCEDISLVCLREGQIVGVLPLMTLDGGGGRVINSLPYFGSNGGVLAGSGDATRLLVDRYNGLAREAGVLSSTVVGNPLLDSASDSYAHTVTDDRIGQLTRLEGLADFDQLFGWVESSAKRNIAKAQRLEVAVEIDNGSMEILRELHQAAMLEMGGTAKQDAFFELVPQLFRPGDEYNVYVARYEGEVVAALLLLYFGRTVEYYTPASAIAGRESQATSLVLATAMIDAARRGFSWWNWGGTWRSQTRVYRFKRKWGAEDRAYTYYTQVNNPTIYDDSAEKILSTYPGFFVVPFKDLRESGK